MEAFIGTIQAFAFSFAPRGMSTCQGQTLNISTNTALFSLIGTYYGGNGQNTFQLPDLQGRTAIGQGTAAGIGTFTMGQKAGSTTASMASTNMPAHNHIAMVSGNAAVSIPAYEEGGDQPFPGSTVILAAAADNMYAANNSTSLLPFNAPVTGVNVATTNTGNGDAFSVQNPFQVLNYCIVIQGYFPSRD